MFSKEAVHERSEFSKEVYEKIFSITGKPKKILDLGCGLDPLSFPYKNIYYLASDIDKKSLKKVRDYFRKRKIKGEVFNLDIRDLVALERLKKVDLVFGFKVFDILKKDKRVVRDIIKTINTKWFIVSFPTKTISGRRMKQPRRMWFERLFEIYKTLRFHNEIFYVIKK